MDPENLEFIEEFDYESFKDIYCQMEAYVLFTQINIDEMVNHQEPTDQTMLNRYQTKLLQEMDPNSKEALSDLINSSNIGKIWANTKMVCTTFKFFFFLTEYHKSLIEEYEDMLYKAFKFILSFFNGVDQVSILEILKQIYDNKYFINFYLEIYTMYLEEVEALTLITVSKYENR